MQTALKNRLVKSPSIDDQHCPKCGELLDEIHARRDTEDPEKKGSLIGWECGTCGYRDMIRETFVVRRRA